MNLKIEKMWKYRDIAKDNCRGSKTKITKYAVNQMKLSIYLNREVYGEKIKINCADKNIFANGKHAN